MISIDKSVCDECGTCISVCPENAIALADALSIDSEKCILCGRCVDICPFGALDSVSELPAPLVRGFSPTLRKRRVK